MPLKLLFLRKFSPPDMDYLRAKLSQYYEFIIPENYSDDSVISLSENADVFLGDKITRELIDVSKKLRLIQLPSTGVDRMNLNALKGRDIDICNSHSNSSYVAEFAVSLMFSLIKKIYLHDGLMRNGDSFSLKNDKDDLLYLSDTIIGKTIGFLGFGNIAQGIAAFMSGFNVKIIANVKNRDKARCLDKKISKIDYLGLNAALSGADVLFICLPLTTNTRDMITLEKIRLMRKTSYIVNISRGPILDQESLFIALKERYIAGAAVDCWYDDFCRDGNKQYPSKNYPFHTLKNIILSPHRAGYIKDEFPHLADVVKNLVLFSKGERLINIIDINAGY